MTAQLRHDVPRRTTRVEDLREVCERDDCAYDREWALGLGGWNGADATGLERADGGEGKCGGERAVARMQ